MLEITRKKYGLPKSMQDYEPLIPDLDKPIEDLNADEAARYFDWFVSHVDERSEYVRCWISQVMEMPVDKIDYSLESIRIVEAFIRKVITTNKTPSWKKTASKRLFGTTGTEDKAVNDVVNQLMPEDLTTFSEYLCRDIGMYIGKMFIINNPELRWDYYSFTVNMRHNNEPQVFGFYHFFKWDKECVEYHVTFEPIMFVQQCALSKETEGKPLYDICSQYDMWVPRELINENDLFQIIYSAVCSWNPAQLSEEEYIQYKEICKSYFMDYYYDIYSGHRERLGKRLEKSIIKYFGKRRIKGNIDQCADINNNIFIKLIQADKNNKSSYIAKYGEESLYIEGISARD